MFKKNSSREERELLGGDCEATVFSQGEQQRRRFEDDGEDSRFTITAMSLHDGSKCPDDAPTPPVYGFDDTEEEWMDEMLGIVRVLRQKFPIQDRLMKMKSSGQNGPGDERGAGGKARKPPPRKQPSTPYSRPPPSQSQAEAGGQRRWLSKLVDPAYRLISSGATRFIPSLFSKPASSNALPSSPDQDHRKLISLRHFGILFLHLILSD
ncbi:hypothetical protein FH972_003390 [Carpinus fangiana]|uniref:Uncharacterized protein n=1 Tax=Carpinus fangiana TaxID=176857 RepID=A0A5N6QHT1_9ROSI|nr:hypothetical protein FH972_003390 [Carpinus fangiana]